MYVRTGKRHYYTLQEKLNIVEQACMFPRNVKPTTRAYSVEAKQIRKWKNNHLTKVSLSHLRTTTMSFRTTGLSRMQRAKNQLVLTSQLGLTQLGIPSLFRALPTRGNPLTFYHTLIVDGCFTAVDIDGTKNKSL
jgi:transposase-like protein